jgi:branched-chain amino acid transport system permease protein
VIALGQFLEVLIGGLMSGVLYSLVALGFVLIFKASGVFNFAQGAMVLLAGLALVRSLDLLAANGFPLWAAIILSIGFAAVIMAVTAWLIERLVIGPLVNQDALTLFMSTIGVTFILEGAAEMIFGSDAYPLRLFPTDAWFLFENYFPGGILVNKLDVWGGLIAGILVAGLAIFFQRTKTGRALRAVADDHLAAQSVGIPISSITFLALKALPVLIIGGFTSVPGAIVGGLIVGAGEKIAEVFLGPHMGGGIEYWFAYVLALAVLLVRPQGLFGERIIERI